MFSHSQNLNFVKKQNRNRLLILNKAAAMDGWMDGNALSLFNVV